MKLTDEQRQRVIAVLANRPKDMRELSDEQLMLLMQEGEALREEFDPEYAAKKLAK